MRQFTKEFLDRIREAVAVSEVIGQHVELKRRGREYIGLCPFHHERTPSFTVNDEKSFYHCFGCGAHGDVIRFLMEHDDQSFPDAVAHLAGLANLAPEAEVDQEKARRARAERNARLRREREERRRKADAAAEHVKRIMAACEQRPHDYLRRKGFPAEVGLVHPKSGHLVIPVRNVDGEVRSAEYITAEGTKRFHPGGEVAGNFFTLGWHRAEIFCVEGYATGLSVQNALRRRYIRSQVRVCLSASNMLKVAHEAVRRGTVTYCIADNDKSGVGEETAKTIGVPYWMPYVPGTDANDYMLTHGIEALATKLAAFRRANSEV